MSVNGKRDNFTRADLIEAGKMALLKPAAAGEIVDEVIEAVSTWTRIATDAGVADDQISMIAKAHRLGIT